MTTTKELKTETLIDPSKVKEGDFMLVSYFVKVESKSYNGDTISVKDIDTGKSFDVRGADLVKRCKSADRFTEEVKASRTEVVKILKESYNIPFTVCFDKEPDKKTGEVKERVMRGRLLGPAEFGRSNVEDVDILSGHSLRLVDHRTIKWLVVKGIKYTVK